jgi:hypothetical protein
MDDPRLAWIGSVPLGLLVEEPNVGRPEEHVQEANDHGHIRL